MIDVPMRNLVITPDPEIEPLPDRRPTPTTCNLAALTAASNAPSNDSALSETDEQLKLTRRFPALSFDNLLWLEQAPGDPDHWFAMEKSGKIYRFPNYDDVEQSELRLVVDMSAIVESDPNEMGMLSFAFHPNWGQTGASGENAFYVSYNAERDLNDESKPFGGSVTLQNGSTNKLGDNETRISLIVLPNPDDQAFDPLVDPSNITERIILEYNQPYDNHNGGLIRFGLDNMLYIASGDGGSGSSIANNNDGNAGVNPQPEIYAVGLRNPWRFSIDIDGRLFAGDVGQSALEEISIIEENGNYGWKIKEGTQCFESNLGCTCSDCVAPIVEYGRGEGQSVTGGYVYRGTNIPAYVGQYIFGDYASGQLWRASPQADGSWQSTLLLNTGLLIASFATNLSGELFVLNHSDGSIHELSVNPGEPTLPGDISPPVLLSNHPCVADMIPEFKLAPGGLPYAINHAFWSDGAGKSRHLFLPINTRITVDVEGDFEFPNGTILVKTFFKGSKKIETRFLVQQNNQWHGHSYLWSADQTEATLVTDGGATIAADGKPWFFPTTNQCSNCHTSAAKGVLGLELKQLAKIDVLTNTGSIDQLTHWMALDLFDDASSNAPIPYSSIPSAMPALPKRPNSTELDANTTTYQPGNDDIAAYLHVNCSSCHRPNSTVPTTFDLRYDTPWINKGICEAEVSGTKLGLTNPQILSPGDPGNSMIFHRANRRDSDAMPPQAGINVDPTVYIGIQRWIASLANCPN